jgi:hypothetical protein
MRQVCSELGNNVLTNSWQARVNAGFLIINSNTAPPAFTSLENIADRETGWLVGDNWFDRLGLRGPSPSWQKSKG